MLIVEITFFIVAAMAIVPQAFGSVASVGLRGFYIAVAAILLITVWFSTLSDALAEQQAKSTAGALRKLETEVPAKKIVTEEWTRKIVDVKSTELRKDDLILIEKGDVVPLDADILEGIAMVDESLVTGESAPVRKAPGDSLIGGSRLVSDTLTAKVTTNPGETFIDQMIKMVESSKRPKTPNEVAVTIVLIGLTAIFTIIILTLLGISVALGLGADLSVLIALYVCLLPTTIGALASSNRAFRNVQTVQKQNNCKVRQSYRNRWRRRCRSPRQDRHHYGGKQASNKVRANGRIYGRRSRRSSLPFFMA